MELENQMNVEQYNCNHQFKRKFYPGIGYRGTSECIKCQLEIPTDQVKNLETECEEARKE